MGTVFTDAAPAPLGHYSQGIVHGGFVFCSGQLGIDPATGEAATGDIRKETELALKNLGAVLQAGGSSVERVVKVTIYITDVSLGKAVNEVYAKFFGDHKPARAMVPCGPLPLGCSIEIEAVGAV